MRIGVISDTHGKAEYMRKALEQMGHIEKLIHAGDHYRDAVSIGKQTGLEVTAVAGNCDWDSAGPLEQVMEVEGHRILVVHGHLYGVKSGHQKLAELMRDGRYDLIVYGHSHIPEITPLPRGCLMNPGSLSSPRRGTKRSYGIIEITEKKLAPYIYELGW